MSFRIQNLHSILPITIKKKKKKGSKELTKTNKKQQNKTQTTKHKTNKEEKFKSKQTFLQAHLKIPLQEGSELSQSPYKLLD